MHRVVPELIVENYKAGYFKGEFPAVGMFLDLSGFSAMTDTLMQHGQHGAEVLAGLMHGVFDPLVEGIFEYGGKIVSFAGDGIMALYPIDADEKILALRALTSAWLIQQRMHEHPERQTVYGKFTFSIKIGLAVGSVSWGILRAEDGKQATYYFRGSAVDGSAEAEHRAGAGEIILTDAFNELLKDVVETKPFDSFHRFDGLRAKLPDPRSDVFLPVDPGTSSIFMPEEVVVHDVRGEFRQIVNLFMRVPDLPDDTLEKFVRIIFELREEYGGLLSRVDFGDKGCNVLILWGAPVAYENDIGRALDFIFDLQARVDFPITTGITYYIAHAGYLGSEKCEEYTCYGWGVNLASRFMMGAPIGATWVDERIARRLSTRFTTEYVGSQHFKGFSAQQKVFELKSRGDMEDVIYHGALVGREEELETLKKFAEPLWQGTFAGILLVMGDAGIGKGRLVHEFQFSDLFESHKALWAVCQSDQIFRKSFNPLRRWLFRYFGFSTSHSPEQRKDMFDAKMGSLLSSIPNPDLRQELERIQSVIGALVDVYWPDSLYAQLDAEGRYNNTFLALITLFKAESLRQPVILFLEDLQFTDEDTRSFLPRLRRSLLAGNVSYPIAVIVSSRPGGESLANDIVHARIDLHGLSKKATDALTEDVLGGTASPELKKFVAEKSEGNPYFVEQIVRYFQEEDVLEMSKEGWSLIGKPRDTIVPGDIGAVLIARLDQLTRDVRETIQTAAVLGREFEVQTLSQMLRNEERVMEHVAKAEKAAVWQKLTDIRYIFSHGLLRDAAYTMQMRARRHELHALAMSALETLYADNLREHYSELAYHAECANIIQKARTYYTLAGKEASELYQNSQAVDYFSRALLFTSTTDLVTRYDLVFDRAGIFSRIGKRDLQLKDIELLTKWASQLNDRDRIAKAMMSRSAHAYFTGNFSVAIDAAKKAQDCSNELADTEQALYTHVVWAVCLLRIGLMDEAMQHAKEALERDRRVGNKREIGRMLSAMGWIALDQDQPAEAQEYLLEGLELAREINDPALEARALNQLGLLESSVNGNYALAQKYYEVCSELAHKVGDRYMESGSLSNLGFVMGAQGDLDLARSYHEQSLILARESEDVNQEVFTLVNLSAIHAIQGDVDLALQTARRSGEIAKAISERSGEAWAELYIGHAHLLLGEVESALLAYRNSIAIREELKQLSLLLEPLAGLVEAYLQENNLDAASHVVEQILAFLETGSGLDGTDEPLRIYYACYTLLKKKQDPRATQVLQTAKNMMETHLAHLNDDIARKRYIENIPWRRAIHNLSS